MRIGFYIDSERIPESINWNIGSTNPGIGGTELAILNLVTELSKKNEVSLLSKVKMENIDLPQTSLINLNCIITNNELQNFDFIVIPHSNQSIEFVSKSINHEIKPKLIIWAHNFLSVRDLNIYSQRNVAKIVNVSK